MMGTLSMLSTEPALIGLLNVNMKLHIDWKMKVLYLVAFALAGTSFASADDQRAVISQSVAGA